jgi:hypothetical protein
VETLRHTPRRTIFIVTVVLIVAGEVIAIADVTGNESGGTSTGDWVGGLIVAAVASLVAAAMLLRFVPATESEADDGENKPARRGLVVAVIALVTVVAFWSGLPLALGMPALVLAAEGRARSAVHGHAAEATAAAVIAGFAIVAAIVLDITG